MNKQCPRPFSACRLAPLAGYGAGAVGFKEITVDKCSNVDCQSLEQSYDREGIKFCSATCADSHEAKNLADAMISTAESEKA